MLHWKRHICQEGLTSSRSLAQLFRSLLLRVCLLSLCKRLLNGTQCSWGSDLETPQLGTQGAFWLQVCFHLMHTGPNSFDVPFEHTPPWATSIHLFTPFLSLLFKPACLSVYHMHPDAQRLDAISDPLELELQMVVRCHVGDRIKPGSSGRTDSALNHWVISPVLIPAFLILKQKDCGSSRPAWDT